MILFLSLNSVDLVKTFRENPIAFDSRWLNTWSHFSQRQEPATSNDVESQSVES